MRPSSSCAIFDRRIVFGVDAIAVMMPPLFDRRNQLVVVNLNYVNERRMKRINRLPDDVSKFDGKQLGVRCN